MNNDIDVSAYRRLLGEIADLCDHASLTGSLESGERRTADRYNAVLKSLVAANMVPTGLFSELPANSNYGEIGVESRMLGGFLGSPDKDRMKDRSSRDPSILVRLAPFIGQEELHRLVQEQASQGTPLDLHLMTALAPFLGQEYLSKLVRTHYLDRSKPDAGPAPEQSGTHPVANTDLAVAPDSPDTSIVPTESESDGIGHLLDMLQDSTLPERERQHIIDRIRIASGR